MLQERPFAELYPGQGLQPQEIISYYHQLMGIGQDVEHMVKYSLVLAQQTINILHGSKTLNIESALQNPDSPLYQMTAFVQPLVYTLSNVAKLAGYVIAAESGEIEFPQFVAGHSLGEYSALASAGAFYRRNDIKSGIFDRGLKLVTFRGISMQQACEKNPGALISINGLDEKQIQQKICPNTGAEIALINAPTLIVVGVAKDGIPDVEKLAKEAGARRVSTLPTAGAFHTSLMQPAASELDQYLKHHRLLSDTKIPVILNLTGEPSSSAKTFRKCLIESITHPVRWAKSLQTLRDAGIESFVEVGPGKSLAALNRINGFADDQTKNVLEVD